MNWNQLLSSQRSGESKMQTSADTRSRFEQDYDRIIFSHPFRRLQDKTQVFPLPEDDFVHTRLTHSLEVSSVGRSLGKNAGAFLLQKYPELAKEGFTIGDVGGIVGAACLAHDLGNPPFGHSGEDSISSFFLSNEVGKTYEEKVLPEEWNDLTTFEGNAQGLRILNSKINGGLKLTFASLGAFTKYPLSSSCEKETGRKSQKKYGYYQCDSGLFSQMADAMGLVKLAENKWSRHPLAFLVEAADDICYHIIDLEDGCRLGLVPFEQVKGLFASIIGNAFSEEKLSKIPSLNQKLGTLRAMTISKLISECSAAFEKYEEGMLDGNFDKALTSLIPSSVELDVIIKLSIEKIYQSKQVLEREAGGHEVIDQLMEAFAVSAYSSKFDKAKPKHISILRLLPEEFAVQLASDLSVYETLQIIIDFISGLTDSHAVRLYQTIKGYRLPV
ncbi:MAG: deoxyguanosinetriphosphate triphosphohydrolase [Cyclobacteriaceae bacterium]